MTAPLGTTSGTAAGTEQGAGTPPATPPAPPAVPPAAPAAPVGADGQPLNATAAHSAGSDKLLTPDQVNQIVTARLAEKEAQHAAAIKAAEDRNGKTELEKAALDVKSAKDSAAETVSSSRKEVIDARIDAALALTGVKPDRVAAVAALVDRSKFAGDGVDLKDAATEAVAATLEAYPEFKASRIPGASGVGTTPPGQNLGVTLDQYKAMDITERTQLAAEKPDAYKKLSAEARGQ